MHHRCSTVFQGLGRLATIAVCLTALRALAQTPEWIWGPTAADKEVRHFRKTVTIPPGTQRMRIALAADTSAELRLNGRNLARNSNPTRPTWVTLTPPRFEAGPAVIELTARHERGSAGVLVRLELEKAGGQRERIVSDSSWETGATTNSWAAATSIGAAGIAPWGDLFKPAVATPAESVQVPNGFKIERLRSAQPEEGSWVSMTVDAKGRLILSPQGGEPMERITLDAAGQVAKVETIDLPVSGAMGLLYAYDSLYVNGQGPQGYHLYRLRDTNGDDQYDSVELLRKWVGGPGEHGAHGIVKGPDDHLYVVCGNFVDLPADPVATSRVRNFADDLVLPRMEDGNGFGAGRKPPGGYVVRLDRDGGNAEIYASGERNTYDIAFNPDGELFGFDSDMEWDWGAPWYRPIRVYHVVSGGDQGFREGSAKWPEYYADSLPPVVNVGIGSPTGVRFGTGARFPAKYQRALYVMDWSYGRILAVHLSEQGASYSGKVEPFVQGKPFNVTDLEIGPDGAMYFTIGGRGTQSGLYRVSYVGTERTEPAVVHTLQVTAGQAARRVRHDLERYHSREDESGLPRIWAALDSTNRHIRFAARVALESQPVAGWKDKALEATEPRAGLTALLALARVGSAEDQIPALKTLTRWPLDSLDEEWKLNKLRVIEVSFARHGIPEAVKPLAIEKLSKQFPAASWPLNRELSQILVALDAPGIVGKLLDLRDAATTQEEQLHYQVVLRKAKSGWTLPDRRRYFAWFSRPPQSNGGATYPDGGSYYVSRSVRHPDAFVGWFKDVGLEAGNGASLENFLKNLRKEVVASLPDNEKGELAGVILGTEPVAVRPAARKRAVVKEWTTADLTPALAEVGRGRDFARGKELFGLAQCTACHQFNAQGGAVGPDLTGVGTRYAPLDVLKSITEPSLVISEQYQAMIFTLKNGDEVTGRLLEDAADKVVVLTDPLGGGKTELRKPDVKSREASKVSPMPEGLLNTFDKGEILDLLAYLISNGKPDAPAFQK